MARQYTCAYNGTLTAAGGNSDLLSLQPADDRPVRLTGLKLGQTSELGDAAEESLRITILRMTATVTIGSGGSAVTPQTKDELEAAAGVTARMNDTTVATTSGATRTLEEIAWNIRQSPLELVFPEDDDQYLVRQGEVLIVRMESTPADDISANITAKIKE